jgi:hypothetical protein
MLPEEIEPIEDMVIVLKIAGYSQTQIARVVGISVEQVKGMLRTVSVRERLVTTRMALSKAAIELLEGYTIEAVQVIVDIMRTSGEDKLVLQAAGEILDRAGIPKASKQERVSEQRTVITDDGIVEKLRTASPEVQEQAAQVIEQLEQLLTTVKEPS